MLVENNYFIVVSLFYKKSREKNFALLNLKLNFRNEKLNVVDFRKNHRIFLCKFFQLNIIFQFIRCLICFYKRGWFVLVVA